MAFDVQGALKAGYSQDEINQYLGGKSQQAPTGVGGAVRGVSDAMRGIGLGAIPNALGEGMALTTDRKVQQDNPFISPQQFKQQKDMGFAKRVLTNGEGEASWLVPELKVAKGASILAKGANLALQGGAQGGLQAASQDGADPASVLKGMGAGALANPAIVGVGKGITGAANLFTKGIPQKVNNALAAKYVGLKNSQNPGIASLVHPDLTQTINNLEEEMGKSYGAVNTFLDGKTAPYGEFLNSLSDVAKKQIPSLKPEKDLGSYTTQIQDWLENIIGDHVKNITGSEMPKGTLDNNTQLPLSVFNNVKHVIGKNYSPDQASLLNEYYNVAKNFVEKHSGDAEHVSSLNKNYNDLREARNMARSYQDRLRTEPNIGAGIDIKGDIPVALAGLLMHGLPGAGVGVAGHELYRHVMKNPEQAKMVTDALTKLGNNKTISGGSKALGETLRQLGIHLSSDAAQ